MIINSAQVKKIAKLSRIKVDANELTFFDNELRHIMNWIEQLHEVNTDGVQPMNGAEESMNPLIREDVVANDSSSEEILSNGLNKYNCFVVPKVVE